MSERFNPAQETVENVPVPSEGGVVSLLESFIGGKEYVEILKEEDEKGLCRLLVESVDDDGDKVEYEYKRSGNFTYEGVPKVVIYATYYYEGVPVSGGNVSEYRDGEWIDIV